MEETPWQFRLGSWYQENGGYVIVCAMFVAITVWFIVKGVSHDSEDESPHKKGKKKSKKRRK